MKSLSLSLSRSLSVSSPWPQEAHGQGTKPAERKRRLRIMDKHNLVFLPPSPLRIFCFLFLFLFGNPSSSFASHPLSRLAHSFHDVSAPFSAATKGVVASKGSLATVKGPEQPKSMHLTPESLAMEGSLSSMKDAFQPHHHQHLHAQIYKSPAMEETVAGQEPSGVAKRTHIDAPNQQLRPEIFFEVSTPLDPAPHAPCASLQIFQNSFAYTYNLPPAMANYTPPSSPACKDPSDWSLVVLTWSGTSIGRQFDRIAAVWFGGVELLRTCTAEPTKRGIFWEVKKDVTKYTSLLAGPQPIVVELGNLVNDIFTGIFHINLTLDFFSLASHVKHRVRAHATHADLILPVSCPSPLPSGHWFQISNDSYVAHTNISVPMNVYRAVLEVYVSFHGDDESWYTNPPNEYIKSNNLTGVPGNGAFREVQVLLDGQLVGAIWPFPVVYTGGIVNLYWRPAAAIGAFNLPTYEFDVSPFIGALGDGKEHMWGIRVENGIGNWLVDGSLHLWLDQKLERTGGKLASYSAPAYTISLRSNYKGLDGTFHTKAHRKFSYSGYVVSSMGNLSVSSSYALKYDNVLVYANNSALQTTTQEIHTQREIRMEVLSKVVLFQESLYSFPLDLSCLIYEGANSSVVFNCNFSHAYDEKSSTFSDSGSSLVLLNNQQQAQGEIVVANSTVVAGLAALQQQYRSEDSHGCYTRVLSTKNSTILYDSSNSSCSAIIS